LIDADQEESDVRRAAGEALATHYFTAGDYLDAPLWRFETLSGGAFNREIGRLQREAG
jgi:hypothetical protein